ncbi:Arsenate reductase [Klebsiella pneumoniae]|nr:Arsenate reductase [Klebsiella pneumoniae]
MGISVRALLRKNVEPYEELGLEEDKFTDDQLIDFMLQHPILINRPIVVTPLGTRLCRPSEVVLDILPDAQKGAFAKEDRVQPAAMLETDVLQRADFSKSGAKMQRYRRDVRTVPHNRYHLAVSLRPGPC